ncbi:Zinc finger protein [Plecturocebus cupreus]
MDQLRDGVGELLLRGWGNAGVTVGQQETPHRGLLPPSSSISAGGKVCASCSQCRFQPAPLPQGVWSFYGTRSPARRLPCPGFHRVLTGYAPVMPSLTTKNKLSRREKLSDVNPTMEPMECYREVVLDNRRTPFLLLEKPIHLTTLTLLPFLCSRQRHGRVAVVAQPQDEEANVIINEIHQQSGHLGNQFPVKALPASHVQPACTPTFSLVLWSLALSPRLECSGLISAHGNPCLSLPIEMGLHHVGPAGLELLTSGDLPASASQCWDYWCEPWCPADIFILLVEEMMYQLVLLPSCYEQGVPGGPHMDNPRLDAPRGPHQKQMLEPRSHSPQSPEPNKPLSIRWSLLVTRLERSGAISAHCNRRLLGGNRAARKQIEVVKEVGLRDTGCGSGQEDEEDRGAQDNPVCPAGV